MRGDKALVAFGSPRQAVRTATDLQARFVEETIADPALPLTVGIGLDAGEAVPTAGGYRGGALNLAARLCGEARAGECLASQEVVHLARRVEGVRYADRGPLHLKGLPEPVRVVAVRSEEDDPAQRLATLARPQRPTQPPPRRARRRLVGLVLTAALVAAAVVIPFTLFTEREFPGIAENSLGLVDVGGGELLRSVELGDSRGRSARGAGAVWVTIPDHDRLLRIAESGESVTDTIPVGNGSEGVAVGEGSIWVVNSGDGSYPG